MTLTISVGNVPFAAPPTMQFSVSLLEITDAQSSRPRVSDVPTTDPQTSEYQLNPQHQAVIQGDPLLTETGVGLFALVCISIRYLPYYYRRVRSEIFKRRISSPSIYLIESFSIKQFLY
jgi:hypothetical protein